MKTPVFTGSATALVTPFERGDVDYISLQRLINYQLRSGTDALVICGTTGEASTLSHDERCRVVEHAVRQADRRVPVIVGTGSNCTETAIVNTREAARMGADAALVVTPYYNKTTQAGLVRHYTAIADAAGIPIILYNVPGRTGMSLTAETYAALAAHPNIAGVKEASGSMKLVQETRNRCPADFCIWSGNDDETAAICLLGGSGVITTAGNVAPKEMHRLAALCLAGEFREAAALQLRLKPLIDALFAEVNPIPVKKALELMDLCRGELRLPLCEGSAENAERLRQALDALSLL